MRNIWKLMQLHVVWHIHQFQDFLWHSMSCICHVSTFSSFSLNCLTPSFSGFVKTRLHGWYHLRTFWRTLERFGDGRHFNFLLQLCCLFWFWSFMPNMESTEIRIFEYNCKRMRRWEKKRWNRCIAKQFWTHCFHEEVYRISDTTRGWTYTFGNFKICFLLFGKVGKWRKRYIEESVRNLQFQRDA